MNYNYPGELGKEIFKAMNANNIHSTDLDREQRERIDPTHTRHLALMILSAILIGFVCVLGIILTLLNYELMDKVSGEVQLLILLGACLTFGVSRLVIWLRRL